MDFQVWEPSNHEDEGGVDLPEVLIIAPGESDHLSEKRETAGKTTKAVNLEPITEVVDGGVDDQKNFVVITINLKQK